MSSRRLIPEKEIPIILGGKTQRKFPDLNKDGGGKIRAPAMATQITEELLIPYDLASRRVKDILSDLCKGLRCDINARPTKQVVRIDEKLREEGKSLGEIYDLGGVRVVVHYLEEIDELKEKIFQCAQLWKLHHSGAFVPKVDDKREISLPHFQDYLEDPQGIIGYRSLHIVVYYPVNGYENSFFPPIVVPSQEHNNKFPVEIQIRTYLLHAWEEKEHVFYSRKVKSEFLQGQFCSIAKLLWHLDTEFNGLRKKIVNLLSLGEKGN